MGSTGGDDGFLAELEEQLMMQDQQGGGGGAGGQAGGGGANLNEDVEKLSSWWLQEESSPELLPFQAELVQDLYELVENQQGFVDEEQADPADADTAVLYTMELDRVKWLLTRYLRARLRKLERQVLFVMQDPAMLERLSAQERAMAEGFHRLMESYATENFLGRLPVNFRSLTELSRDRGSLVEEPDLDEFVFCRVQNNVGLVQVDDSAGPASQREGSAQDLRRGDVHVLKYRVIRPLVLQGDVELI